MGVNRSTWYCQFSSNSLSLEHGMTHVAVRLQPMACAALANFSSSRTPCFQASVSPRQSVGVYAGPLAAGIAGRF